MNTTTTISDFTDQLSEAIQQHLIDARKHAYATTMRRLEAHNAGADRRTTGAIDGTLTRYATKVAKAHGVNVYGAISCGRRDAVHDYHAAIRTSDAGEVDTAPLVAAYAPESGTDQPSVPDAVMIIDRVPAADVAPAPAIDADADPQLNAEQAAALRDLAEKWRAWCAHMVPTDAPGDVIRAAQDQLRTCRKLRISEATIQRYRRRGMVAGRRDIGAVVVPSHE